MAGRTGRRMRFNRNFNINKVVKRLVQAVLGLYVGGTIITVLGQVMNGTYSPFYKGLKLIGWTVETVTNGSVSNECVLNHGGGLTTQNCITDTSGSGVLAVIGIIAIAGVVLEFVSFY